MNLKDIARWNVRVSMVYAVGIWTMMGTYGYYQVYLKKPEKTETEDLNGADKEELVDEIAAKTKEEKPKGFLVKSTVVYRENFVPYSTRLLNYLKTLSGSTGSTADNQGPEK